MTLETTRRIEDWARAPKTWFGAIAAVQMLMTGLADLTRHKGAGALQLLASSLMLGATILLLPGRVRIANWFVAVAAIMLAIYWYLAFTT